MTFFYKRKAFFNVLIILIKKNIGLKAVLKHMLNYLIIIALMTYKTFIAKKLKYKKRFFSDNIN